MTVASLCIHTIDIQVNTGVNDGAGNVVESWANETTGVKARIQPLSADEREGTWKGEPTTITHRIYIAAAGTTIDEARRIVYDGRYFNVMGVRDLDEWGKFLAVDCEEVR